MIYGECVGRDDTCRSESGFALVRLAASWADNIRRRVRRVRNYQEPLFPRCPRQGNPKLGRDESL